MSEVVLVVAAHPDDEILGCGGTIARLSQEQEVHILFLGKGIMARQMNREQTQDAQRRLHEAAKQASATVGATAVHSCALNLADNAFDTGPLLPIIQSLERKITWLTPTTIYTHHAGDLNVDHRLTFQAVLTACRPIASCSVKNIYSFEVPSATDWAFQQFHPWAPTHFVNITDTLERKLNALACYTSEARAFPHPRSPEAIRARAICWGSVVGCPAAEAFSVIRQCR